jgi:phosphinothricin acetyltransferase
VPDDIRPATPEDAEAIASIYAPFVRYTAISFETEVPDVREIRRRMSRAISWLVSERGDSTVGYAYAAPLRSRAAYAWSVEVSVYISEPVRGSGVGGALLDALLRLLSDRGFVNAFAGTTLPNAASVALFESRGFRPTGTEQEVGFKLGSWHDVGWWQRRLQAATVPPPQLTK